MSNDNQQKVVFAFSQGKVPRHQRAVHGKALNPSMGAPTPLIDGLGTRLGTLTPAGRPWQGAQPVHGSANTPYRRIGVLFHLPFSLEVVVVYRTEMFGLTHCRS